jgi:CDP-diacylglycerol--glycerol-3-phosphate 3-phosphatidyltransferase
MLVVVAASAVPAALARLPNFLTVARLAMIPPFVVLVLQAEDAKSWPAAILFGVAGVTDQVDGFLARRWRVESAFGKVADPLADRLMIDAAVVLLFLADRLPWPALLLIVGRDALLVVGYRLLAPRGYDFEVNALGKVATWVLYAAIGFIMVTSPGTDWPLVLFWAGVAVAVAAGTQYLVKARREVRHA